ncbi:MAG: tetratricopeptide repeat protein [Candidatus Acidiferrum sp.]
MDTGSQSSTKRYCFGPFEMDPTDGALTRDGVRVKLQELPYRLLLMLVERPGVIVTREEVRQRLWAKDTFLEFDNSLSVAVRKVRDALGDNADAPQFVETIPRRGYRFLAMVEPLGERASATTAIASTTEPAHSPRNRFFAYAGVILICAVSLSAGAMFLARRTHPSSVAQTPATSVRPSKPRRAVAVLGFRNVRGRPEDEWMSFAFTEMMSTELSAGGTLRVLPNDRVAVARREIGISQDDYVPQKALGQLKKNPGADIVVVGSYVLLAGKSNDHLRLDIRVLDTTGGDVIAQDSVTGDEQQLFELVSHAGADLRTSLGVYPLASQEERTALVLLPTNEEAVKHYSTGNEKLWAFDFVGAREELTKAVAADPSYPLAHSSLSYALSHLGYRAKASAEAKRASELSAKLPREQQLLIAGQFARSLGDWATAERTYKELFDLRPDSLDDGLLLAAVQVHTNPQDAIKTTAILRALPGPAGEDPRIDLLEASSQMSRDLTAVQAAAKRAVVKGSAIGSPLVVARAYGVLCQQSATVGSTADDITRDCQNAIQGYAAAGDRYNEARTLNDFAGVFYAKGDLRRAEQMWRKAAAQFQQLDEQEGAAATYNNLGDVLLLRGELAPAARMLNAAIPHYEAIEDSVGVALVLNDLGIIAHERGDLQNAEANFRRAGSLAAEANNNSAAAFVLNSLGDLQVDRDDLEGARKSYEESLRLRTQIGETQNAAETQLSLARVTMEKGHAQDAENPIRKCKAQFQQEEQRDDELSAGIALEEALLAERKLSEAKVEAQSLGRLADQTENAVVQMSFQLVRGRILARSREIEASRVQLEKVRVRAKTDGLAAITFEAELALDELLRESGHTTKARQQLIALEKSSRQIGFELIARKAAALIQSSSVGSEATPTASPLGRPSN